MYEVKRVKQDFDWELYRDWIGYTNPYESEFVDCAVCQSGWSKGAWELYEQWYGYTHFEPSMTGSEPFLPESKLVQDIVLYYASRRPNDYDTTPYGILREATRLCDIYNRSWSHHLDQDDVNALIAEGRLENFTRSGNANPTAREVNEWSLKYMGHDSINCFVCVKAKAKRLDIEPYCSVCKGEGSRFTSNVARELYENWKEFEPETGNCYQVWHIGVCPVSPVFENESGAEEWLKKCLGKKGR